MNWYSIFKLAQVWAVESTGTFGEEVSKFYELEYKRSVILTRKNTPYLPFDRRLQTILQGIDTELTQTVESLTEIMQRTLGSWLKAHAITDPRQWASARVNQFRDTYGEEYNELEENPHLDDVMAEYARYHPDFASRGGYMRYNQEAVFRQMMREVDQNPQAFPAITQLMQAFAQDRVQMMEEELSSEGFEAFGDNYGQQFVNEQQAEQWIRTQATANNSESVLDYYDFPSFRYAVQQSGLTAQVAHELSQNLVFPLWYAHWKPKGIDNTRNTVQRIYDFLTKGGNLPQRCAALNLAINASHQNGSILDYIYEYGGAEDSGENLKELLTSLTNGSRIPEWNKELREARLKV